MRWTQLLVLCAACGTAAPPAHPSADCDRSAAEQAFASQPSAAVILVLRDVDAQAAVLDDLGAEFQLGRRYQATAALAGTLTRNGFERAKTHAAVRCVQLDGSGSGG